MEHSRVPSKIVQQQRGHSHEHERQSHCKVINIGFIEYLPRPKASAETTELLRGDEFVEVVEKPCTRFVVEAVSLTAEFAYLLRR